MLLREIAHLSPDYWSLVLLREAVLRTPLGLTFTIAELLQEASPQRHFGLWEGEELIGCALAYPLAEGIWKIRQVAIAPKQQGCGLGRHLMLEVERNLMPSEIQLNARQSVQGFYERLGYVATGEPFVEIGLPHRLMVKNFC